MEAILILLLVGLLISSFMISGTIPALIYYGLALLTPQTFLPIGCIICAAFCSIVRVLQISSGVILE